MNNDQKIQDLEGKLSELTARLELLTSSTLRSPMSAETDEAGQSAEVERTSSRRGMLKLAGAAAIGVVGATVVSALPAAADNGIAATSAANPTTLNYTGSSTTANAFLFQTGSALPTTSSSFPAALAGWSSLGAGQLNGVYGLAVNANGTGVVGHNDVGVGTGVRGTSTAGVGVKADGATGIVATGVGTGANVAATAGTGIKTSGTGGDGIFAGGTGAGFVGVRAFGGDYAIHASISTKANLWLQPNNNFISNSPKTVPSTRSDAHLVGELESVDGDLYFCVAAGSPGTWRKITGPGVAGGFHALTPGRVYDSRQTLPLPGVLGSGSNRTISVADRRDATLTTGAVVQANFVPAGATAVAANVTITGTKGGGFLVVNPGGNTTVGASTINWSADGQNLANGVILTLDASRQLTIIAGGGGSTDFIIDISGYYL
ncbi:MAG: hypothetical protein JWL72_1023 [Ilumatobacteraceae bacterium]|nr:hypothetical protein [Ilumatobacteraceae bacterium]MCU1387685.1 hypothetical protein [Ilumatobacteraceae bacterium]